MLHKVEKPLLNATLTALYTTQILPNMIRSATNLRRYLKVGKVSYSVHKSASNLFAKMRKSLNEKANLIKRALGVPLLRPVADLLQSGS